MPNSSCPSFLQLYTLHIDQTQEEACLRFTFTAAKKDNFLVNYFSLIPIILGSANVIFLTWVLIWDPTSRVKTCGLKMSLSTSRRQHDSYIFALFLFMDQKTPVMFFHNMKCKQIFQTYPISSGNCSDTLCKISGHAVIRRENPELLK